MNSSSQGAVGREGPKASRADTQRSALHPATEADATPEALAERIRRLQAEAKTLAKDHVRGLTAAMTAVERMAAEIAEGGDAYPAGVRELCGRLVEDIEARVQTLEAIVSRTL